MTDFEQMQLVEAKIRELASLVYDGWDGNIREICTDYAYLLTEGGKPDLLDRVITQFKQELADLYSDDDDDDDDDCEDES